MKHFNAKLIIGILGLILCLSGQSCQKDEQPKLIDYAQIECQEIFAGDRSGLAPFLNLLLLTVDSTQVTSNPTQIQFNGAKITNIQATASGGQPAIYLNIAFNHYANCTVTFADGTKWIHNKPIYISNSAPGNLNINGSLPGWSGLALDHPNNLVRYVRTNIYKAAWLPYLGRDWRVYTFLVNGRRMELPPVNKSYQTFRLF